MPDELDGDVSRVFRVLNRYDEVDSIRALAEAFRPTDRDTVHVELERVAFCLDSSVLLPLAGRDATDLVDTLTGPHTGPLILPGQVIIEFWNNHDNYVKSIAKKMTEAVSTLENISNGLRGDYQVSHNEISDAIERFRSEYGFVMDAQVATNVQSTIDALSNGCISACAPRTPFRDLAFVRKSTKMPPGFKDSGDGDFFVWVDFLLCLLKAGTTMDGVELVVLLTRDEKKDWSKDGVAHPLLVAEVRALVDKPFETWNIKNLEARIRS